MTSNALTVFTTQLESIRAPLAEVLADRMPVDRLMRTLIISCERTPKLLDCDRQSLFNAAYSAAVLGLEVDGITGQAFLIPYANKAQLVIGYKGYTTMAARSGYTVTGAVVREGDQFSYALGTETVLTHVPANQGGRITHAWAVATNLQRPPIVAVLPIADIIAIKQKSPGARKSDSPWNDPAIGFVAMAEKSAKRRLARSMPLNVMQYAARLEEAFDEQGRPGWIDPRRGVVIEGELGPPEPSPQPTAREMLSSTADAAASAAQAGVDGDTPPSDAGPSFPSIEEEARHYARQGERRFVAWWKNVAADKRQTVQAISGELRGLMVEADEGKDP